MQAVYISNRPQVLQETLGYVALFMPFIDQAVACVPDSLVEQLAGQATPLPLQIIPESAILSGDELDALNQLDHQRRNYLLRSRIAAHPDIDAEFIMSDDDARPLKTMDQSRFVDDSRHHRFYYYDLRTWNNNQTEFDAGQLSTCTILEYHNLPLLSYASHMPQIIDRALFLKSVDFFARHTETHPLCEWSSYFNYAGEKQPQRFHSPQAYLTLCWPEHPLAWKVTVQPPEFLFENFTSRCYKPKAVFDGISTSAANIESASQASIEKITRWRKYVIDSLHPEQGTSLLKYLNWRTWINKLFKHQHIS